MASETFASYAYSFRKIISLTVLAYHGTKEHRLIESPGPYELQIAVTMTGLCGSDLHYYNHYRNGDFMVKEPLILGHESAGHVVAVGSAIPSADFELGDKVTLEVGIPCGSCRLCQSGRYNICKDLKFGSSAKSFPHAQGTLQERINHPARWCHKLPANLSLERGALLEPLGVAIQANRRAALPKGGSILVFGAGAVGMLVAGVARLNGAKIVVIADINAARVDFAVKHHFAHSGSRVLPQRGESIQEDLAIARDTAEKIAQMMLPDGSTFGEADAIFECTGVPSCVQASIFASRPGGKVVLIGMGHPVQTLPISAAALREVDLIGSFRYADTYPEGIEILSRDSGPETPEWDRLITHTYEGLQGLEQAFVTAANTENTGDDLVIKVMVGVRDGVTTI